MSPAIYPNSYIRIAEKKKTRKPEYIILSFIILFLIL